MIFIFGYDQKDNLLGPTEERKCPHCHNTSYFQLREIKNFISLFFIPVIPVKRKLIEHCPICNWAQEIPKTSENYYRDLAALNQAAINGLADDEYLRRKEALKKPSGEGF
ncbi:zinc-ribbon domain-containing protein [Croceimicrobium sp.]|uniref:zinc-ribbon domain-containing protein n=1 Tax=Croceimicrobium sp. TaxID=2828340 RepID=UPI003BA9FB41